MWGLCLVVLIGQEHTGVEGSRRNLVLWRMDNFKLPPSRFCRLPFAARRSPFAVRRSPFAVRRSPFAVRRSPFAVRRSPFAVRRSPFAVRRWRVVFAALPRKLCLRTKGPVSYAGYTEHIATPSYLRDCSSNIWYDHKYNFFYRDKTFVI